MKLRNKSTDCLNRPENGLYRIKPGDIITISDGEGAYLLEAEPGYWELAPENKPAKGGK